MSLQEETHSPTEDFITGSLTRMAGWLPEAADDPECLVVTALVCAVFFIVGLIFVGIGAASGIGSGGGGLQG